MYTKNDILARLRAGEDMDAIADQMAAELNEAKDAFAAELVKKEEEATKRRKKREALAEMLAVLAEYLEGYTSIDADVLKEIADADDETLDKYAEQIDALVEFTKGLKQLEFEISKFPREKRKGSFFDSFF